MLKKSLIMIVFMSALSTQSYSEDFVTSLATFIHRWNMRLQHQELQKQSTNLSQSLEKFKKEQREVLEKIVAQQKRHIVLTEGLVVQQRTINNVGCATLGAVVAIGGMMLYEKYTSPKNTTEENNKVS